MIWALEEGPECGVELGGGGDGGDGKRVSPLHSIVNA